MDKLQRIGRYFKHMLKKRNQREENDVADFHFTTHINEEERTIFWCIENISRCPLKLGEYHESPAFSIGSSSEIKWTLRIYPKGRKIPEKFGVFIHKLSEKPRTDMKYLLEVKLIPETTEVTKEPCEIYSCKNPGQTVTENVGKMQSKEWGTDELIPANFLVGKKSIWVICYLSVVYVDGGNVENCFSGATISLSLYDNLNELYKSGKFSDVSLQVQKKRFFAHRAILASRSKFFADMFDQETGENATNMITLEDVEPSVMSSVLQFIYTGKVEDLTLEKAVNLFSVASKFFLEELQTRCLAVMLAKLSVENVCEIAVLADEHSVPKLKTATNYIFRKYKHELLQRKEWKELICKKPHLASDILQAVSSEFNTAF